MPPGALRSARSLGACPIVSTTPLHSSKEEPERDEGLAQSGAGRKDEAANDCKLALSIPVWSPPNGSSPSHPRASRVRQRSNPLEISGPSGRSAPLMEGDQDDA